MTDHTKDLYDYLYQNAEKISKEWFDSRSKSDGSTYAINASSTVQETLKKQHVTTVQVIASGFLKDEQFFRQKLQEWVESVVVTRLEWETPIYEVIEALNKTREVMWQFIASYSLTQEWVQKTDVIQWSEEYEPIVSTLINALSKRYHDLTQEKLRKQKKLIEEIHSPVISVSKSTAVLPLIGAIDESRASSLFESVPEKCARKQVSCLIIDLSGVSYMDTFFANHLFQLVKTLKLIGIEAILSGIRPEVAQTAVHLGLNFSSIKTYHELRTALFYAPM